MHRKAAIIVLCVLAFAGCAQGAGSRQANTVNIAPELSIELPRPSKLGRSVQSSQLVSAHYGSESYVFEGHVNATPDHFVMIGLDSLGRKAMTVTWTDAELSYEIAPWLPSQLRPENILADMVLMYWPEAIVRQMLAKSGGSLVSAPQRRSVMYQDKEIIRVEYATAQDASPWSGPLHYHHFVWNYELDVQSSEAQR